ncbi:DEAD/DEAH box helicase family protein [Paenibacillus cremeus]|uniref:DNA helicase n=1 Tax=Paenibacillus cremeus TaxID=2163881 RepID=A0A559JHQ3_9BACL|nr:DEAD/DEAH box helicase family protein [Paenibacillus cremeus]TVX99398.1 DNA helicase [Paenibacillus cremeus]
MMSKQLVTSQLFSIIEQAIQEASSVYILASFAMESGVKLIKAPLHRKSQQGGIVKILVGDYLYITEPEALRQLHTLGPTVETRLWISSGKSFHPKAYLFHHPRKGGMVIVGSSNLSKSALRDGIEWNLAVHWAQEEMIFEEALDEFMTLFTEDNAVPLDEALIESYETKYGEFHQRNPQIRNVFSRDELEEQALASSFTYEINKNEEVLNESRAVYKEGQLSFDDVVIPTPKATTIDPRDAQLDAIERLTESINKQMNKALVIMATGLGKTYLAAFFAKRFFRRILFVAHREEILRQAKQSFEKILPERSHGFYYAKLKEKDADCVFASVTTLGLSHHIEKFNPSEFDLIIIDEFHHAAADSYQRILSYFQPQFLLGLTATPDRMDGKDIYELCGGNVVYEIKFFEAISKGWLAPFHYYGVYDDTDYSLVRWIGTRYDQEELLTAQMKSNLANNLFKSWEKHKQTRTIAFCSSVEQAQYLCHFFQQQGHSCINLHAKTHPQVRKNAVKQLEDGSLEVIFTVDLFNEGVDIPAVDTLLFARPTESLTVFTQQMGRGLRLSEKKSYCTIIDLIGNYRNVNKKFTIFRFDQDEVLDTWAELDPDKLQALALPLHCEIDFDLRAIDLLRELSVANRRKYQVISPNTDIQPDEAIESIGALKEKYHTYPGFSKTSGLSVKEEKVYSEKQAWFQTLEKTGMQKSYKMVLLLSILRRGPRRWLDMISPLDVAVDFHSYLTDDEVRKQIDFSDKTGKGLWDFNAYKTAQLIADNPMNALANTGKEYFRFEKGQFHIGLETQDEEENQIVYLWTYEIAEKRLNDYFANKQRKAKL